MKRWLRFMVLLSLILTVNCSPLAAQNAGGKGGRVSKLGPELVSLYDEYSSYLASRKGGTFRSADPLVRVIDDSVVIDAVASGDVNVLKADLESLGMQQAVAHGRIVSGQLPISAIPAMAVLPSLNFARGALALPQGSREPLSPGTPNR
jgi:hypothetical protein